MKLDLNKVCSVCGKRRGTGGHIACSLKVQKNHAPTKAAKKVSYKKSLKYWGTFD